MELASAIYSNDRLELFLGVRHMFVMGPRLGRAINIIQQAVSHTLLAREQR